MRLHPNDFEERSIIKLITYSYKRYTNLFFLMAPFLVILLFIEYYTFYYLADNSNSVINSLNPIIQFFLDNLTLAIYFSFLAFLLTSQSSNFFTLQLISIKQSLHLLVLLLTSSVIYFLLVMIGSVIFIVPGFLFLIWFYLYPFALSFEKVGVIHSFKRSRQLVKGNFFRVLIVLLFFLLLREALYFVLTAIQPYHILSYILSSLVTIPAESICLLLIYFSQRSEKEAIEYRSFLKELA